MEGQILLREQNSEDKTHRYNERITDKKLLYYTAINYQVIQFECWTNKFLVSQKKKKSVSQSFITVPSYNLVYSSKTCSTSLIKLKSPTRKFSSLSLILPLCSVSLLFLVPHTARAHRYHRSRTSLYLILLSTASTIMQSSASCTQVSHWQDTIYLLHPLHPVPRGAM